MCLAASDLLSRPPAQTILGAEAVNGEGGRDIADRTNGPETSIDARHTRRLSQEAKRQSSNYVWDR